MVAASLLFIVTALWLMPAGAEASTWSTVTVDNSTNITGKYTSMAADPSGKLHIGYLDTNTVFPVLKYATNAGGSWVTESLQAYVSNITLASTSTVYTPAGPRIMAYSNNLASGEFKYQAVRKILGDGWQLQDIAGGKFPNGYDQPGITTIHPDTHTGAVQHQGFTFITYSDGDTLWYANERDMYYYPFEGEGSGNQSDLAVDANGDMHIVYVNPTSGLMHSVNNTAPESLVAGTLSNPVVAIDGDDTMHVCYVDDAFNIMYLNKLAGGSWTVPAGLASVGGAKGGHLSLKADGAGGLHLAYYSNDGKSNDFGYLHYTARSAAGSWLADEVIPPISQSNNYGEYASLVVDQDNNISIGYYDGKRSKLCVAQKMTPAIRATPEPAYFGNIQLGAAATELVTVANMGQSDLTLAGPPALSGVDAGEFTIMANTCTAGLTIAPGAAGCAVTVQLAPTSPGTKSASLVIGSNDPVIPAKAVELRGVSYGPADSFTITSSVGVGGTISPDGSVTVDGGDNLVFTITPDPGFLVGGVVVNGTAVGALRSYEFIEVDADQTIAVSFIPVVPVALWEITEVDDLSGLDTGKYCSIANDDAGKLYVGYLDTSDTAAPLLKYVTNADGSWSTPEQVPMPNVTNAGTATVYTPNGPRIMAYSDDGAGSLKYQAARRWADGSWELQDIAGGFFDPPANTMPQPPLASIDETTFTGATQYGGFTFISYTDGDNLWYANERDMYYYPFEAANPVAGAGKQSDLVLDSLGDIHIVYYNPNGTLIYGTNTTPQASSFEESVLVNATVSDPGIAIDSQDTLHVSYVQNGRVMYLNGALVDGVRVWAAPYDLGPCGNAGAYTSIEANGLDIVHLAYYGNNGDGSGSLMYAQRMPDGAWSIPSPVWSENEAPASDYGHYAALVVDDHHNVNIAYYDATRSSLKVAKKLIPVISVSPDPVNFGYVLQGQQSPQTVTIRNSGESTLMIGSIVLAGADASEFSVTADNCSRTSLANSSASCDLTVTFAPTAAGDKTAALIIPSNDPYTSVRSLSLIGSTQGVLHTINATAGNQGSITPEGAVNVPEGGSQSFTITPDDGLFVSDVLVDGLSVGPVSSYAFDNVTAGHTIDAYFASYVRVSSVYFGTLQDAYNASGGLPMQIRAAAFSESISCNMDIITTLQGGYDAGFATQGGATTLSGSLEVSNGGVEVQNLGLE
jgi:hypothetical protein